MINVYKYVMDFSSDFQLFSLFVVHEVPKSDPKFQIPNSSFIIHNSSFIITFAL